MLEMPIGELSLNLNLNETGITINKQKINMQKLGETWS